MAGNTISVMSITSSGRGGRQSEILPRTRKDFTVQAHQNIKFRCERCNSLLPLSYKEAILGECPFCHAKNSIVTLSGRKLIKKVEYTFSELKSLIISTIKEKPKLLSRKAVSEILGLPYSTVVNTAKSFSKSELGLFKPAPRSNH